MFAFFHEFNLNQKLNHFKKNKSSVATDMKWLSQVVDK